MAARYHTAETCTPPCPLHSPSDHHMVAWPLQWRAYLGIFERTCPHGIGHPDPDSIAYARANGKDALGIHGCDGCCQRGDKD